MGHYISRITMADEESTNRMWSVEESSHAGSSSEDSDSDLEEYAIVLRSLIDSVRYSEELSGSGAGSTFWEEFQDSDLPKIKYKPSTSVLDKSEFSLLTKQLSGLNDPPRKKFKNPENLYSMVLNRERGNYVYSSFSYGNKCEISNKYLPNKSTVLDHYPGKAFCGSFSNDGNYYITASQDRNIRLYNAEENYKLYKTMRARDVGWSIIDVAFSPDKQHFVYSTWSSSLHQCSVDEQSDHQEPLCLTHSGRRFCIFSIAFSSNGREILGGANDGYLYIYDRERNSRTLKIPGHDYDVNTVTFANDTSQIIYSGADDGIVKVWDRRTLDESAAKPVGVLVGHIDGITFIDSRGDGRHLISNSKDQTIKLWDIRVFSGDQAAERSRKAVHEQTWDYRWQEVPRKLYSTKNKLEGDTSLMTYRGHVVVQTLVRCRFSPLETTGQRYIYTGCGLGRVVIYDALTGRIEQELKGHRACVRDVAWHPYRNEIMTACWDGAVRRWYYNGVKAPLQSGKTSRKKSSGPVRRSARLAKKKQKKSGRT